MEEYHKNKINKINKILNKKIKNRINFLKLLRLIGLFLIKPIRKKFMDLNLHIEEKLQV